MEYGLVGLTRRFDGLDKTKLDLAVSWVVWSDPGGKNR